MRSLAVELPILRSDAQWTLVAQEGGEILPVRSFPCRVGRHPNAPIRILDPTVSLSHAEFREHAGGLLLADLGSRNGTFVNGQRVQEPHSVLAGDLLQFGAAVFRLQNSARPNLSITHDSDEAGDLALAVAQFEKLISDGSIIPVYQPIVAADTAEPVAFEALARSCLFGLEKPAAMFRAAQYFRREAELSRLLRRVEVEWSCVATQPHLFLNTHPVELHDLKALIVALREIRALRPNQMFTLEVHEAAAAELNTMKMLRLVLDDLNMKLAYDDFGIGQARLNELVEARPDYVKFDRQLISGLDKSDASRRQMVKSLVALCRKLGIATLAEGVETAGEAEVCRKSGFNLMQGFYFGRPTEPALTTATIPAASLRNLRAV